MTALIANEAPEFILDAVFPNGETGEFSLRAQRGRYVALLFYPMDFSAVCPSEILEFHRKSSEFEKRGCVLAAISVDSVCAHAAWRKCPLESFGVGAVSFPLLSDSRRIVSRLYGVLHDDAVALRGLFLIDRDGIVRHCVVNDLPLMRSADEALRMLDELRDYETNGLRCRIQTGSTEPRTLKRGDEA